MNSIFNKITVKTFQLIIARFPFVSLCALVATLSAIGLIANNFEQVGLIKVFQAFYLGIPLFLSIDLFLESIPYSPKLRRMLHIGAFIVLAIYFLLIGNPLSYAQFTRFIALAISLHLSVSFSPFLLNLKEQNAFWHFNQVIFTRLLISGLYSIVLYMGLSIALLALEQLFGWLIKPGFFYALGVFILGFFNTSFFLFGIPSDFQALRQKEAYPQRLKLFILFVLFPLVFIYLVILYIYGIQMLVPWNLPKGWVAYLIIVFSVSGIFCILLIYPIRDYPHNYWLRQFCQWFYLALLPLIFLLFVSIQRRIYDYGVTEYRYYVALIAIWLTGISTYFLLSKIKNIQYIPISLSLLLLVSAFDPWGAVYVARNSQLMRWHRMMEKYELLKEGKIDTKSSKNAKIPLADLREIEAIIQFLKHRDVLQSLQSYFETDLDSLFRDTVSPFGKEEKITLLLGNEQLTNLLTQTNNHEQINFSVDKSKRLQNIKAYDYMIRVEQYSSDPTPDIQKIIKKEVEIAADFEEYSLKLLDKKSREVLLSFDLQITIQNLIQYHIEETYQIPSAEMTLIEESLRYKAKLVLENVGIIRLTQKDFKLSGFSGTIFLKIQG